jgi:hypothetical protein
MGDIEVAVEVEDRIALQLDRPGLEIKWCGSDP